MQAIPFKLVGCKPPATFGYTVSEQMNQNQYLQQPLHEVFYTWFELPEVVV